jgi:hypothetical protein
MTNHRLVSRLGARRRGGEVVKLRRFRYARPGTIDRQVQFLNKEGFGRLRIRPLEERELPIGFQNLANCDALRRLSTEKLDGKKRSFDSYELVYPNIDIGKSGANAN